MARFLTAILLLAILPGWTDTRGIVRVEAAAPDKPAPVADAAPARFECSDGTISTSQEACLVNMARARLPPSQPGGRVPPNPGSATGDMPTGSLR